MRINPYLNFDGHAEEAFLFYQSILGGEFVGGISYFGSMENAEKLPESEKKRVMHVTLKISPDLQLMASDTLPSAGHELRKGNHNYILLDVDSLAEAERIFNSLSEHGKIEMEFQKPFWGSHFGIFEDRFGIGWMINFDEKE